MTPSQIYYYANLDKFAEYQHIRNNAVRCDCCNHSYRKEYITLHNLKKLHLKNKRSLINKLK